ncbi:MAG: septum formation protein Maf [Ruminococcaceae bacterium]|nr:septum formation protein Maf [Oscillospiraceae bacterium]
MRVILASKSPRRREILSMLGVKFEILSADADESSDIREPAALVRELALRKGRATRELLQARGEWNADTLIIASDTVVAVGGQILGKPRDAQDAKAMLRLLSGKEHQVISGVALLWGERECADFDTTGVRFADMDAQEIDWYVQSGEPSDKAGAYAVQGLASMWIKGLDGDYFNVVGLPVYKLNTLAQAHLGRKLTELHL